jgi:hypothetical protein
VTPPAHMQWLPVKNHADGQIFDISNSRPPSIESHTPTTHARCQTTTSSHITKPPSRDSNMESTPTLPSSINHSPLFSLPQELRDMIYEYAFRIDTCASVTKEAGIPEPALLSTCKIVREEAIPIFYGQRRLNLVVHQFDPAVLLLWETRKQHLAREYKLMPTKQWFLIDGRRSWDHLMRCLHLYHSGTIPEPKIGLPNHPSRSDEKNFVRGLYKVVRPMKGQPWSEVRSVLCMLRPGLVKLNRGWQY